MVNGSGIKKPYVHFLGNSAIEVTGSMYLVRHKKYYILLDCGLIQGNDIVNSYKRNKEQLKKIKPTNVDYIILHECHIDHTGLVPALFAKGCQAHVYVPEGSIPFLKLLWEDTLKIMQADCLKIQHKHGIKAAPLYTQEDVNRALDRCIEVGLKVPYQINQDIEFTYYPSGHIINARQIYLQLKESDYVTKKIGFTGDIGGPTRCAFTEYREELPFVDLLIGENTYNSKARPNNVKDRTNDVMKIRTIAEFDNKILFPCFSLQRTQELITLLINDPNINCPIYLDSPLAAKICNIWPWGGNWRWPMGKIKVINSHEDSVVLQESNEHCIIISASGFMNGGRVLQHLKTVLPNRHNHIIFIGYAGENNLASQIKSKQPMVTVEGRSIPNNANITELRSFSSHASYEELIDYYTKECRFNKLALVHGEFKHKVDFSKVIQKELIIQGKSARVICTQQDQKIYL